MKTRCDAARSGVVVTNAPPSSAYAESGAPPVELGAEGRLTIELRKNAQPADPDPVDE